VSLSDALIQVALSEPFEEAIAAFDWALHTGILEPFDLELIVIQLPRELQVIGDWVDPACESFPESLSRTRLRLAGHTVRSQALLPTGERTDLVVDEIVGLEVDGEEFHINRFFEDRDKDLTITLDNLHAIRPTAKHVFNDWARVHAAITAALRQRAPATIGNSGTSTATTRKLPRIPGIHPRHRRRTPEFPKAPGATRRF
jgi:very-short-patch-repair endonuclease